MCYWYLLGLKFSVLSELRDRKPSSDLSIKLFQKNAATTACCTGSKGADCRTVFQVNVIFQTESKKNLLGVLGKRCCMFSVWLWQGCHFWQGAGGSYPCRCSRSPIPITQRHCTVADEWVQFSCWVAL